MWTRSLPESSHRASSVPSPSITIEEAFDYCRAHPVDGIDLERFLGIFVTDARRIVDARDFGLVGIIMDRLTIVDGAKPFEWIGGETEKILAPCPRAVIVRKTIVAPFRARVGMVDLHVGQYLDAGTLLTTLQGVDAAIHVDFSVVQGVAAALREGDRVEVVPATGADAVEASVVARHFALDEDALFNGSVNTERAHAAGEFDREPIARWRVVNCGARRVSTSARGSASLSNSIGGPGPPILLPCEASCRSESPGQHRKKSRTRSKPGRKQAGSRTRPRTPPTGSTATTFLAPAYRAPCTALIPTPPQPKTTTVSPARVPPACTAELQPVVTPQPTSAAGSNGRSSSIFTHDHSGITAYCENVPSTHIPPRSVSPSWKRKVRSGRQPMPRPLRTAPLSASMLLL